MGWKIMPTYPMFPLQTCFWRTLSITYVWSHLHMENSLCRHWLLSRFPLQSRIQKRWTLWKTPEKILSTLGSKEMAVNEDTPPGPRVNISLTPNHYKGTSYHHKSNPFSNSLPWKSISPRSMRTAMNEFISLGSTGEIWEQNHQLSWKGIKD